MATPATPTTPPTSASEVIDTLHTEISGLFDHVSDPDADRGAVLQRLLRRMAAHASAEKQHLAPAITAAAPTGGADPVEAAKTLDVANQEMEKIVVSIERRSLTSPDLVDLVNELLADFDAHLEHYRQDVRPLVTGDSPLAGDTALAADLAQVVDDDDAHPHPLLPNHGPLGRVGRAVASAIDTTRNKTVDRK